MNDSRKKSLVVAALPVSALVIIVGLLAFRLFSPQRADEAASPSKSPNVILISLDTTRVDHLSCYGYTRNTTPHIDEFAETGHKFTRAVSTSPWTLPAHASLFTGTYVSKHGARFAPKFSLATAWPMHVNHLDERYSTLAEILSSNGYNTAGIAGGPWFHEQTGLWRGFDFHWDISRVPFDPKQFLLVKIPALDLNKVAFEWLDRNHEKPFFLFINYFDAHSPYEAPRPFNNKFGEPQGITDASEALEKVLKYREPLTDSELESLILAYDNEISYMDFHFGRLMDKLKSLDAYDDSIIIVTSDHGEHFGEHDLLTHTVMVFEEVLRIPLIIKFPKWMEQQIPINNYVQLVDIMPTILSKLGIPVPDEIQGADIHDANHPVIAESFQCQFFTNLYGRRFAHDWRALYKGDLKYIYSTDGTTQLFDLSKDPAETDDLSSRKSSELALLQAEMTKWLSSFEPYPFSYRKKALEKMDKQTRERLRGLGYIE